MAVITLSRQYNCNIREIVVKLAGQLGYKIVDKEIIKYISIISETPIEKIAAFDEEKHSNYRASMSKYFDFDMFTELMRSDLKQEQAEFNHYIEDNINSFEDIISDSTIVDSGSFKIMMEKIIRLVAQDNNVIIVGRGGQCILKDVDNVLHVRFVSKIEDGVASVSKKENLNNEEARNKIVEINKRRKKFLKYYYKQNIEDPLLYHIVINMSKFKTGETVNAISDIIQLKGLN